MAKVLVTGGSGFIGSHLVNSLVASGHQVSILDNNVTSNPELGQNSKAVYFLGDVCDSKLVNHLVFQSDCVFHLASAVGVLRIMSNVIESIHSTVVGGINVLQACQKYGKRILLTSTSEIYGKFNGVPFEENTDRTFSQTKNLRWSYAEAKSLLENVAYALAADSRALDFVTVRLFNTIGPGQLSSHGMVVPRFVKSAIRSDSIYVYGDGSQRRSFCDVRDVVEALIKLMFNDQFTCQVYNIGSSEEISILDLAHLVRSYANSSSQIEFLEYSKAYPQGFEDTLRRTPNIQKIYEAIGWKPRHQLAQTLMSIIEYERNTLGRDV